MMKNPSAHTSPPFLPAIQRFALLLGATAGLACLGTVSHAEPPGRGAERGARSNTRPALIDSWRNVQRDFAEAKDNVRRDFYTVRENVRRESERVRYEVERRRPREFQFVHVLDALFGRPGGTPEPIRNEQWQQDYGDYRNSPPPPPHVAEQWRREDAWAEQYEDAPRRRQEARQRNIQQRRLEQQRQEDNRSRDSRATQRERSIEEPRRTPSTKEIEPKQEPAPAKKRQANTPPATRRDSITTQDELPIAQPDPEPTPEKEKTKKQNSLTKDKESYPYGLPVPGKTGMVYSPHTNDQGKYVDVRNIPAGTLVKDPYTDKFFRVP